MHREVALRHARPPAPHAGRSLGGAGQAADDEGAVLGLDALAGHLLRDAPAAGRAASEAGAAIGHELLSAPDRSQALAGAGFRLGTEAPLEQRHGRVEVRDPARREQPAPSIVPAVQGVPLAALALRPQRAPTRPELSDHQLVSLDLQLPARGDVAPARRPVDRAYLTQLDRSLPLPVPDVWIAEPGLRVSRQPLPTRPCTRGTSGLVDAKPAIVDLPNRPTAPVTRRLGPIGRHAGTTGEATRRAPEHVRDHVLKRTEDDRLWLVVDLGHLHRRPPDPASCAAQKCCARRSRIGAGSRR